MMDWLLHSPILRGALSGLIAAAAVDFAAFRAWQSFQDARTYQWSLAFFRWGQGAILGALSAAGLSGVLDA